MKLVNESLVPGKVSGEIGGVGPSEGTGCGGKYGDESDDIATRQMSALQSGSSSQG